MLIFITHQPHSRQEEETHCVSKPLRWTEHCDISLCVRKSRVLSGMITLSRHIHSCRQVRVTAALHPPYCSIVWKELQWVWLNVCVCVSLRSGSRSQVRGAIRHQQHPSLPPRSAASCWTPPHRQHETCRQPLPFFFFCVLHPCAHTDQHSVTICPSS